MDDYVIYLYVYVISSSVLLSIVVTLALCAGRSRGRQYPGTSVHISTNTGIQTEQPEVVLREHGVNKARYDRGTSMSGIPSQTSESADQSSFASGLFRQWDKRFHSIHPIESKSLNKGTSDHCKYRESDCDGRTALPLEGSNQYSLSQYRQCNEKRGTLERLNQSGQKSEKRGTLERFKQAIGLREHRYSNGIAYGVHVVRTEVSETSRRKNGHSEVERQFSTDSVTSHGYLKFASTPKVDRSRQSLLVHETEAKHDCESTEKKEHNQVNESHLSNPKTKIMSKSDNAIAQKVILLDKIKTETPLPSAVSELRMLRKDRPSSEKIPVPNKTQWTRTSAPVISEKEKQRYIKMDKVTSERPESNPDPNDGETVRSNSKRSPEPTPLRPYTKLIGGARPPLHTIESQIYDTIKEKQHISPSKSREFTFSMKEDNGVKVSISVNVAAESD